MSSCEQERTTLIGGIVSSHEEERNALTMEKL
jgi:hypothetical protein